MLPWSMAMELWPGWRWIAQSPAAQRPDTARERRRRLDLRLWFFGWCPFEVCENGNQEEHHFCWVPSSECTVDGPNPFRINWSWMQPYKYWRKPPLTGAGFCSSTVAAVGYVEDEFPLEGTPVSDAMSVEGRMDASRSRTRLASSGCRSNPHPQQLNNENPGQVQDCPKSPSHRCGYLAFGFFASDWFDCALVSGAAVLHGFLHQRVGSLEAVVQERGRGPGTVEGPGLSQSGIGPPANTLCAFPWLPLPKQTKTKPELGPFGGKSTARGSLAW